MINNHSPIPSAQAIKSDAEASPYPSPNPLTPNLVPSLLEWNVVVSPASNFYVINVTQNKITQTQVVKSTNQCKEKAYVSVIPDVPADVVISGYTLDPENDPSLQPNDIYKTIYTVYVDDPYTYHYENKTFGRRKDKEDGNNVVYEAKVTEGVCSKVGIA